MILKNAHGFLLSFALHVFVLIGLYSAIPIKPLADIEPAISVSIISDSNSSLGDTSINKESPKDALDDGDDLPPSPQTEIQKLEPVPLPVPKPLPTPKTLPAQKLQPIAPKPIEQKPVPQKPIATKTAPLKPEAAKPVANPSLKTAPKTPVKPSETAPNKNMAKANTPKIPAPKNNGALSSAFDIPAATSAANGSASRSSPKLSNGVAKKTGNSTALRGDLNSVLREQVKHCWREPADLSNPQSLIVELDIELSIEGRLARTPRLLKPSLNGATSSQKVAIENAISAAKNCAPYDLPSERYNEWQRFTFRFNPMELKR